MREPPRSPTQHHKDDYLLGCCRRLGDILDEGGDDGLAMVRRTWPTVAFELANLQRVSALPTRPDG